MTIQEKAIEQLERISEHLSAIGEKEDYTDIAIKALEAQPCIEDYPTCTECEHYDSEKHYCPRFCQVIKDTLAEAQPSEDCVNCISRESIKQKLQEHRDFYVNAYGGFSNLSQNDKSRVDEIDNCIAMVVNEPSVTPQRPKGKWIKIQSGNEDFPESIVCSRCKNENSHLDFDEHSEPIGKVFVTSKYCPNCGAEMSGGREDEVSD